MHTWNNKAPTSLLLGRFQPWHAGHQALFEQALRRSGQVLIGVRDTQGVDLKNPFDYEFVRSRIVAHLEPDYAGRYQVMLMPNITNFIYGRDVGYVIEQVHLGAELESISATQIRALMQSDSSSSSSS